MLTLRMLRARARDVPRETGKKVIAQNRKARHDYSIDDVYEAGIQLTGTEVKSLRAGRAAITDGYGYFDGTELWLKGVHIPEYDLGTWTNHEPRRSRNSCCTKKRSVASLGRSRTPESHSCRCRCISRMALRKSSWPLLVAERATTSVRRLPNVKPSVKRSEPSVVETRESSRG